MSPLAYFTNPLFIDIETVSSNSSFEELSDNMKNLWCKKANRLGASNKKEEEKLYNERAGIYAEFGKIIVIAVGYIGQKDANSSPTLYIRGLANDNEHTLLTQFKEILDGFHHPNLQLCGHNGKEFDFPYISRRMTINNIVLPSSLDTSGKKPWEVSHLDTMEMWKFGDRKNFTSLDTLANLFNIPSSKENMKGSEVNSYYYEKNDLPSILRYCMDDVVVTAQVFRRLRFLPLIESNSIKMSQ